MALDPYANASYETNPYVNLTQANRDVLQRAQAEQQEKMKHAARMAQQQDRYHPAGPPVVSRPLDLEGVLQSYENLLSGLLEQIDALQNRLGPVLLDATCNTVELDKDSDPTGSHVTMRVYHLNATLRFAAERLARVTHEINL